MRATTAAILVATCAALGGCETARHTGVACRNASDTPLNMILVSDVNRPDSKVLAGVTSGKGAMLNVEMYMPASAGLIISTWGVEPPAQPLPVPLVKGMKQEMEVEHVDGVLRIRNASIRSYPSRR
ncbi:MAG: hypothetical protein HUU18_06035 [Phycisphaerales bacterium]|jgi:hypothetical protein|nr:hypothetical protein [Phycisphaerales bacterium]